MQSKQNLSKKMIKKITINDAFDFFGGFLFIPIFLFWVGFSKNILEYAIKDKALSEGEVLMAIAIVGFIWKVFERSKLKDPLIKNNRYKDGFPLAFSIGTIFYISYAIWSNLIIKKIIAAIF